MLARPLGRFALTIAASLAIGTAGIAVAQDTPANAEIIKLVKAGIPEAVILRKIAELRTKSTDSVDSSTDALIALKDAGASDAVLNAMVPATTFVPLSAPPPAFSAGRVATTYRPLPPPVKFKYNSVEFVSIKALKSEFRVTIKLANNGDKQHVFYGGRSVSYDPPLGQCEQAGLSDELGNAYPCKTLSIGLLEKGGSGRGSVVAPGDSIAVVYSFSRADVTKSGQDFSFSAAPFADFYSSGIVNANQQQWANLDVQFDNLLVDSAQP